MKRTVSILGFMMFISSSTIAVAQTIIENAAKPDNSLAGRVVTLKEEMRIEDTGRDFYIKSVYGLKASVDGSVFVRDEQTQLLQFDSRGRFVRNFMKSGQGPGKLTGVFDHLVTEQNIFLIGNPPKILIFDFAGKLAKEVVLQQAWPTSVNLISSAAGYLLFAGQGRPDPKGGDGWRDIPQEIVAISQAEGRIEALGNFPIRGFFQIYTSGVTSLQTFSHLLAVAIGDGTLALSHSPEYLIKVFDPMTRKIVTSFKRPYKRQPRIVSRESGGVSGMGKTPSSRPSI
jgi:hypothetical protein